MANGNFIIGNASVAPIVVKTAPVVVNVKRNENKTKKGLFSKIKSSSKTTEMSEKEFCRSEAVVVNKLELKPPTYTESVLRCKYN